MRETNIERSLTKEAKRLGGLALKFVSPGAAGVPDRLVILPGDPCPACGRSARIGMLELKAPGKEPDPLQADWIEELQSRGVPATWTDSKKGVRAALVLFGGTGRG